jgi:hypothetical protein
LRARIGGFDGPARGDAVRVALLGGVATVFDAEGEGARLG